MNKQIVAVVVALVVLVGGYFLFNKMGGRDGESMETPTTENEQNNVGTNTDTTGKKMSFDSFLRQGGAYVCTVNQSVQGMNSQGTVYVDGSNVRGEFNSSIQGMSVKSEFLVKDGYSYSWSNMMANKGFKIAVNDGGSASNTGTSGSYSFNAEQIGDYNCEPWSVDNSKFALPSGVIFTEVNQ